MHEFDSINWIAVLVGTVVSFLVGWAWYSPLLFGKKWAEGSGVELASADKMPVFAMIAQLLALLVLSIVIGITAASNALFTAILAILAVALFIASTGSFVRKSTYAIIVDFFYIILAGVVMIAVQGLL
ncbi:hypothetical protein WH96_16550 [Kiloniella spongiae]|uniref:Twitching motility protein PilT n=1 Tax=Kiloniella spongiae TaxID=1489064 RepID=A0A0H2MSM6_9PROT|nr:DUF1761 domain-containing protein [Kiloniella spongiae]KLN59655.1 hypothetical protein WH96_16550 [Kiloniella spongiae]